MLVLAGDRDAALKFLTDWFSRDVHEYLKICDPYFGPNDLEVLRLLASVNPVCKVRILTSKKHQTQEGVQVPWEDAYRAHWRVQISDQDPPDTDINIVGVEPGGGLPVHDRWWLTKGSGIRVGTSFNSLGRKRDSEISLLSPEESALREREVDQYIFRHNRRHNGERVRQGLFIVERGR